MLFNSSTYIEHAFSNLRTLQWNWGTHVRTTTWGARWTVY